jgi:hypothetical protein
MSNTYNRIPVAFQLGMLFLPSKPLPKTLSSQACLLTPANEVLPKRRAYALYRLRLPALSILF